MSVPQPAHGPQTARPEVVVALPVRNAGPDVAAAIRSALDQGERVDVHLFDNLSDDDTLAVAERLLPPDNIHPAQVNGGAVANFQRAYDETTGEFFLWLAHDDRLGPGAVVACLDALRTRPLAAAALPTVQFLDPGGNVVSEQKPLRGLDSPSPYRRLWTFVDQVYWVEIYSLFRRSSLEQAMPLTVGYGFDVALTWRLLLRQPYCLAPAAVLRYRTHPGQTTKDSATHYLPPGQALGLRWPNATLWRQLWQATAGPDLEPASRRAGRIALLSVIVRSSTRTRLLRRVRARARRMRR